MRNVGHVEEVSDMCPKLKNILCNQGHVCKCLKSIKKCFLTCVRCASIRCLCYI